MKSHEIKIYLLPPTLVILILFATGNRLASPCTLEYTNKSGQYYVIGLSSMLTDNSNYEIDKNAVRFHLKLRYLIARQEQKNSTSAVGFISYNVCNDISYLVQGLINVFLDPHLKPGSSTVRDGQCNSSDGNNSDPKLHSLCPRCSCTIYQSNVIAIVSYLPAYMTRIVADLAIAESIPVYAFAKERLENVRNALKTHPNFYSSFGMINDEIYRLTNNINEFGIKHIFLVNIGLSATGLSLYHQEQLWKFITTKPNICAQRRSINSTDISNMNVLIKKIRQDKTLQMIVLWSNKDDQKLFVELTGNITNRIWFWYTDFSYNLDIDYILDPLSLQTHIFIRHPIFAYQHLNTDLAYRLLKKKLRPTIYEDILNDKWIASFMNNTKLNVSDPEIFKEFDIKNDINDEYVEAIMTPLWWSQPFRRLGRGIEPMWKILRALSNVGYKKYQFDFKWNIRWISNKYSDVEKAFGYVQSIQRCPVKRCLPGHEPKYGIYLSENKKTEFYSWHCAPCSENFVKSSFGFHECQKCPKVTIANTDKTQCFDPYNNQYLKHTSLLSIVSLIIAAVGSVFVIITIYTHVKYRQTPVIKSAGYSSCLVQLLSHIILFISLPAMLLIRPTQLICSAYPILFGLLLSIISSITLSRTQLLLFVFNARGKISKRGVFISKSIQCFAIFMLCFIQFIISFVSFFQSIPDLVEQLDQDTLTRDLICDNHLHVRVQLAYIIVMSAFCLIQSFRARNLPRNFKETKRVLYSMFLTIVILLVSFPIDLSMKENDSRVALTFFSLTLINFIQVFLMYTYKVYIVFFRSEKNTREAFRIIILESSFKGM